MGETTKMGERQRARRRPPQMVRDRLDRGGRLLSLEAQYDEVRQLVEIGKEKGYLLSDEVNELLPTEITTSDELGELFTAFWPRRYRGGRLGTDVPGGTSCSTGARTTSSGI